MGRRAARGSKVGRGQLPVAEEGLDDPHTNRVHEQVRTGHSCALLPLLSLTDIILQ